ncbi:MAG: hypothetical protein Alpg2KO_26760 [Alphaproteobacteria bacterium]
MRDHRISAVLGPTNTGKTWLAVDRMLAHGSGMIGFPLRLLARENYDRIVASRGKGAVALITGEEKIIPPNPRFFCCTVEAMPLSAPVSFMAVDEIQLAGDPERGHVFTDRLLRRRGQAETMVMGASTIAPLIRKLVPDAEIQTRPRFSTLHHTKSSRLHRLPRRSAVVGFSATQVYRMAERLKRRHGGTAVVMGALSPRTRNAQVEMYQAGEVDYLVATDAIGMGLNMDIDHVALASLYKYDGNRRRRLTPQEMAQIAGRAGRHMSDGTFNTLADGDELTEEEIERIINHDFKLQEQIFWRSATLDYRSPRALLKSLEQRPKRRDLLRLPPRADDTDTLAMLIGMDEIMNVTTTRDRVELLWDCCQIPDFRQTLSDAHAKMVATVYTHLLENGVLPEDWVARQIAHLDRKTGDIDALMARLAHIRTLTFITHRGDWLDDARHWQGEARRVEDMLSDLLHERLTARFVDRRAAVLLRSLDSHSKPTVSVRRNGEVLLDGHPIGHIEGLRFKMDESVTGNEKKAAENLVAKPVAEELATRVAEIIASGDGAFSLADDGVISWQGQALGRLTKGEALLKPTVVVDDTDGLETEKRDELQARLDKWLVAEMAERLGPLVALAEPAEELTGSARGIAFQLYEAGGVLWRPDVADLISTLEREQRQSLYRSGIRFGSAHIYMPLLTKPAAVRMIGLLWWLNDDKDLPAPLPPEGRMSHVAEAGVPKAFYKAISYPVYGDRAVRVDILDRLESALYEDGHKGLVRLDPRHANLLGVGWDEAAEVIRALGHRKTDLPREDLIGEYDQKLVEREAAEKAAKAHKQALRAAKAGQLPTAAELAAIKKARAEAAGATEAEGATGETAATEASAELDAPVTDTPVPAADPAPEATADAQTKAPEAKTTETEAPAVEAEEKAEADAKPEAKADAAEQASPAETADSDSTEKPEKPEKPEREIYWFRLRRSAHGAKARGGDTRHGGRKPHGGDHKPRKGKGGGKHGGGGRGKQGGGGKRGGQGSQGAPLNNPFADLLKK